MPPFAHDGGERHHTRNSEIAGDPRAMSTTIQVRDDGWG